MTKSETTPAAGIFGPEWHKWRGATLHVALEGEPPFVARLDAVGGARLLPDGARDARLRLADLERGRSATPTEGGKSATPTLSHVATLTVLDTQGRPVEVRQVEWPPEGKVRVVRAP